MQNYTDMKSDRENITRFVKSAEKQRKIKKPRKKFLTGANPKKFYGLLITLTVTLLVILIFLLFLIFKKNSISLNAQDTSPLPIDQVQDFSPLNYINPIIYDSESELQGSKSPESLELDSNIFRSLTHQWITSNSDLPIDLHSEFAGTLIDLKTATKTYQDPSFPQTTLSEQHFTKFGILRNYILAFEGMIKCIEIVQEAIKIVSDDAKRDQLQFCVTSENFTAYIMAAKKLFLEKFPKIFNDFFKESEDLHNKNSKFNKIKNGLNLGIKNIFKKGEFQYYSGENKIIKERKVLDLERFKATYAFYTLWIFFVIFEKDEGESCYLVKPTWLEGKDEHIKQEIEKILEDNKNGFVGFLSYMEMWDEDNKGEGTKEINIGEILEGTRDIVEILIIN